MSAILAANVSSSKNFRCSSKITNPALFKACLKKQQKIFFKIQMRCFEAYCFYGGRYAEKYEDKFLEELFQHVYTKNIHDSAEVVRGEHKNYIGTGAFLSLLSHDVVETPFPLNDSVRVHYNCLPPFIGPLYWLQCLISFVQHKERFHCVLLIFLPCL